MASVYQIFAISLERVPVTITPPLGIDPTSDPIVVAFMPAGQTPTNTDWRAGDWAPKVAGSRTYQARVLVGPGSPGGALAPGEYQVITKVTDSPEAPVKSAGILRVI